MSFKSRKSMGVLLTVGALFMVPLLAWAVTFIPPVTSHTVTPQITGNNGWSRGSVDVTLTSVPQDAAVTQIDYVVNGSAFTSMGAGPAHFTIDTSVQGTNTLEYSAFGGSREQTRPAIGDAPTDIRIDSGMPTFTADAVAAYSDVATITLTASDTVSGIARINYRVDAAAAADVATDAAAWAAKETTYVVPGVRTIGTHTITFYAADAAGNAPGALTKTFVVNDTLKPVTTITTVTAPSGIASGPVTVSLTATDSGSGVANTRYSINGAAATTYTAPFVVAAEGTTTVTYRSVDASSHAETTQTAEIKILNLPEVGTDAVSTYPNVAFVKITATDTAGGVASISSKVDTGTTQTVTFTPAVTASTVVTVTGAGAHTVTYCASDTAGNTRSGTATFTITLGDGTAPVTTISTLPVGWSSTDVSFSLSATDPANYGPVSGVKNTFYRLGSTAVTTYTAPVTVSAEGTTVVSYRSIDTSNNSEATKTATILVDKTAPSAPLGLAYSSIAPTTISLSWGAATDAVSGVVRYDIFDGTSVVATRSALTSPPVLSATLGGLAPGTSHAYTVRAVDAAGNFAASSALAVTMPSAAGSAVLSPSSGTTAAIGVPSAEGTKTVSVSFPAITATGTLTVLQANEPPAGAPAGFTFLGAYYDVSFTGSFTGTLTISFPYDPRIPDGRAAAIKVGHWKNGAWIELPTVVDTTNHTVTIQTASLSPFALMEPTTTNVLAVIQSEHAAYYPAYGKSVVVNATLVDAAAAPLSGQTLVLQRKDGAVWSTVATFSPGAAAGSYSATATPLANKGTSFQIVLGANSLRYAALVAPVRVVPEMKLSTPSVSKKTVARRGLFSVSGKVDPHAKVKVTVKAYRKSGKTWKYSKTYTKTVTASSSGSYKVSLRIKSSGYYKFRSTTGSDKATSTYAASVSSYSHQVRVR